MLQEILFSVKSEAENFLFHERCNSFRFSNFKNCTILFTKKKKKKNNLIFAIDLNSNYFFKVLRFLYDRLKITQYILF